MEICLFGKEIKAMIKQNMYNRSISYYFESHHIYK